MNLYLVIIPAIENYRTSIVGFSQESYGYFVSGPNDIRCNKVDDGYSIIMFSDDVLSLSPMNLLSNISKLVKSNVPDTTFDFQILHFYKTYDGKEELNIKLISGLMKIDDTLSRHRDILSPLIYRRSESIIQLAKMICRNTKPPVLAKSPYPSIKFKPYGDESDIIKQKYSIKDSYEQNNQSTDDEIINMMTNFYNFSDDKEYKEKKKHKRIEYAPSRVIRASNNPKKYYKRHGVVVCSDKRAIKKDARIIKDFLDDFIPGNSKWRKDLKKDLCKRWVKSFAITKSKLKDIEREYKKQLMREKNLQIGKEAIDFTSKILYKPVDIWNDPNK